MIKEQNYKDCKICNGDGYIIDRGDIFNCDNCDGGGIFFLGDNHIDKGFYLDNNFRLITSFFEKHYPMIKTTIIEEGAETYLECITGKDKSTHTIEIFQDKDHETKLNLDRNQVEGNLNSVGWFEAIKKIIEQHYNLGKLKPRINNNQSVLNKYVSKDDELNDLFDSTAYDKLINQTVKVIEDRKTVRNKLRKEITFLEEILLKLKNLFDTL